MRRCRGYVLVAYKTKFSKLKKNYDTAAIEKALPEVRKAAPTAYIAIQSAVPLGFTYNMGVHLLCDCIFACPALVRPSFEMQDMETPSRIVVGASKYKPELVAAATQFAQLLAEGAENNPPILCMGDTEAEASALFADTFRALKAGFFNELDTYAKTKGLHSEDIIRAVTLDPEIGQSLSIPNFGVIAASANQLETSYDDVPQRGAAPPAFDQRLRQNRPHPPERCLSRQAGIVRCCLRHFAHQMQKHRRAKPKTLWHSGASILLVWLQRA